MPVPASGASGRAMTGAGQPYFFSVFGGASLPPAFSQVPFGTIFHSAGSLSAVARPAQPWVDVPQSFWPALATPKHFSSLADCMSVWPEALAWAAQTLASAAAIRACRLFMGFSESQCTYVHY